MARLPRAARCAHRGRPCGGPCPEGGPCAASCVPCHTILEPQVVTDLAALVADGEVELTGTPVEAWLSDVQWEPILLDLAYVETISEKCVACDAYVVDGVGEIKGCAGMFCPFCAVDSPGCHHLEHG